MPRAAALLRAKSAVGASKLWLTCWPLNHPLTSHSMLSPGESDATAYTAAMAHHKQNPGIKLKFELCRIRFS